MILHDSVGSEQVVQEIDCDRGHYGQGKGQLSAGGDVTADS